MGDVVRFPTRLRPVPLITQKVNEPDHKLWSLIAREQAGEDVAAELDAHLAQLEASYSDDQLTGGFDPLEAS